MTFILVQDKDSIIILHCIYHSFMFRNYFILIRVLLDLVSFLEILGMMREYMDPKNPLVY